MIAISMMGIFLCLCVFSDVRFNGIEMFTCGFAITDVRVLRGNTGWVFSSEMVP